MGNPTERLLLSDFHFSQDRYCVQQVRGISVLQAESLRACGCALLLALLSVALSGCRALRSNRAERGPAIEFTRVPPAEEGGPDTIDIIQGRVVGAHPGQQIVLYAKNGTWWVQPLASEEFTRIGKDSTWVNSTHVGTEYAALLVEPGHRPPITMRVLPKPGGAVMAVANVKSGPPSVSKTLSFSGYEWRVRDAPSDRGGWNIYSPNNAWTDAHGALHLRIAKVSGQWTCAEVSLTRSLGYGTYSFVVQDTSHLEPAAVFSIFTWDYGGQDQNYREVDIEVSRWGDPTTKNAQYVVQPFYVPENVDRFTAPPGVLTYSFRWEPGRVLFRTVRGFQSGTKGLVAEHPFTSGVPSHGIETVRIDLYVHRPAKIPFQNAAEAVVERFEYLP
jgi:hypothetical protein